jgi:uncharacterized spore protein YtfJ
MDVDVRQAITEATGVLSSHSVFGDPVERDGATIITAARVRGGGGGGAGVETASNGAEPRTGWGGGASIIAEPVGAYVVQDGTVKWHAAVDVNNIVRRFVVASALVALAGIRLARKRENGVGRVITSPG